MEWAPVRVCGGGSDSGGVLRDRAGSASLRRGRARRRRKRKGEGATLFSIDVSCLSPMVDAGIGGGGSGAYVYNASRAKKCTARYVTAHDAGGSTRSMMHCVRGTVPAGADYRFARYGGVAAAADGRAREATHSTAIQPPANRLFFGSALY
jgi:hypothetical protein